VSLVHKIYRLDSCTQWSLKLAQAVSWICEKVFTLPVPNSLMALGSFVLSLRAIRIVPVGNQCDFFSETNYPQHSLSYRDNGLNNKKNN